MNGRTDGSVLKLQVRKPILDFLLSPGTSPGTKQLIINGLIHAQTNGKKSSTCVNTQDTTPSESPIPTNKLSTTTSDSSTKITKPSGFIDETFKIWKETEEKFLIDTIHIKWMTSFKKIEVTVSSLKKIEVTVSCGKQYQKNFFILCTAEYPRISVCTNTTP